MSTKAIRQWNKSEGVLLEHKNIKITQVYCWIYTADKKIIIVSKDGRKWQFPGGHPKKDESLEETAIREIQEETNIDISKLVGRLKFFGYYLIKEFQENNKSADEYLQTRFLIKLDKNSNELTFKTNEIVEDFDKINFVRAVSIKEVCKLIPWLGETEELRSFERSINV